jgi:hypothetical protein
MIPVEGVQVIPVFAVTRVWRGKWLISECVNGRTEARGDMYSIYNSPSRWQPIAVSTFSESSRVNSFYSYSIQYTFLEVGRPLIIPLIAIPLTSGLTKICGAK